MSSDTKTNHLRTRRNIRLAIRSVEIHYIRIAAVIGTQQSMSDVPAVFYTRQLHISIGMEILISTAPDRRRIFR